MAAGKCRHCGHQPVGFDARECPLCFRKDPNPSAESRYAGIGTLLGALTGGGGGALWGYLGVEHVGGAIVGFLLGALAGSFGGLIFGWLLGLVIRMLVGEKPQGE